MKYQIENVITNRLPFLRTEDKQELSNELLSILNDSIIEKENARVRKETERYSLKCKELAQKDLTIKNLERKIDILNDELKSKFSQKESKTIAYQLGESIIKGINNPREGVKDLPRTASYLIKESVSRKSKKKSAGKIIKVLSILLDSDYDNKIDAKLVSKKNPTKELDYKTIKPARKYININKEFTRISYDYGKKSWPSKVKNIRLISILDEISETSWSEEFKLFRLVKSKFEEQIGVSTANGMFIESCWKGNEGEWEYAFTSPGLKHKNAQNLLKALDIAKEKRLPILFWNKEDPMHYEKFLPIAKKCDVVFTTDSNKLDSYKKDLGHDNIYCLPFAANPYICNPMNRSRYEEENICFAGSYYSVGHDDRKLQMDEMLPALLKLNGVIYDRMSKLDNERYYFPNVYKNILRDSVSFKDMTALYKHFKIFLNVNTITDSPTMMSRRVYELLACGTPVISTPSKAIEKQFSGIVQIATNAAEAEAIARELLDNPWKHARLAHLGYREVMLNHTYENRKDIILSSINIKHEPSKPLVSIILPTMRPHFIDRIVSNIGNQTYSSIECIIITQNYSKNEINELKSKFDKFENVNCKIIENNSSQNLGARLNQALSYTVGDFIAKFDDDDLYFPNYLTDMMLPFKFGDWSVVGKKEGFFYLELEDKLVVKYPNQRHIDTDFVMGATLVMKKSDLVEVGGFLEAAKGEDSDLLRRMKTNGKKIYAADPFNFVVWRSKDSSSHSWNINKIFYESNCDYVDQGLASSIVVI